MSSFFDSNNETHKFNGKGAGDDVLFEMDDLSPSQILNGMNGPQNNETISDDERLSNRMDSVSNDATTYFGEKFNPGDSVDSIKVENFDQFGQYNDLDPFNRTQLSNDAYQLPFKSQYSSRDNLRYQSSRDVSYMQQSVSPQDINSLNIGMNNNVLTVNMNIYPQLSSLPPYQNHHLHPYLSQQHEQPQLSSTPSYDTKQKPIMIPTVTSIDTSFLKNRHSYSTQSAYPASAGQYGFPDGISPSYYAEISQMHPNSMPKDCYDDSSYLSSSHYNSQMSPTFQAVETQSPEFNCFCGKKYASLISLKNHTKLHGPRERNFICEVCHKGFLRKQDLKRHETTHLENYHPFSCTKCGTTFTRSDALSRHLKANRC